MSVNGRTMKDLIPEKSIVECYDLKPTDLAGWRRKVFPYIKLTKGRYAYWEDEVVKWLSENLSKIEG